MGGGVSLLWDDFAAALVWAGATVLLGTGAWRAARRLAPGDSLAARTLHTTILCWAVLVGVATLLGTAGVLVPAALLAGVAAAATVLCWWGGAAHSAGAGAPADASGFILWAVLLALWSGFLLLDGMLRFPTDWDTLMYHLPLLDQWLHARSLYAPREAVWYNPGNNELVGLWLVAPFSGDFLIGLNNLPAATVLVLSSHELGRELGFGRPLALVCALTLVGNAVVFKQLTDAENDVAVAGLFLAALYYAARFATSGCGSALALGGIAVGLLAGIKYYALGYAGVAGAALVLTAWLARGRRAAARAAVIGLLGALLWGGYWYARNTCVTGAPTYPKGFTAATNMLSRWSPAADGLRSTTLLGNGRPEILPLTVEAVQSRFGPGAVVGFLGLPVTAAWLLTTALRRRAALRPQFALRGGLLFALLGSGLVWGMIPWAVESELGTLNFLLGRYQPVRFGLGFLSLGILALAVLAHDLGRLRGRGLREEGKRSRLARALATVPIALLAAGAAYQFYRSSGALAPPAAVLNGLLLGVNVALFGAILVLSALCWPRARRWLLAAVASGALLGFAALAARLAERWHEGFAPFYGRQFGTDLFQRLAKRDPTATRICALTYRYYPFFGSRRQYAVARPHREPTYGSLDHYLLTHDLNVVVAAPEPFPNGWYRAPAEWIDSHAGLFRTIEDGGLFAVYEVNRELLQGQANALNEE